ncbi:MAG TPA: dTDP-4-dehydrorhamnose 3,5-epimerase [Rhizobium sp.]|nr:dTDP-4-dehydrorhamnose 3,5-epimerase [Rhizobium sp.]
MTARFDVEETAIPGVLVLTRRRFADDRGYLSRLFCAEELEEIGWRGPVAQINETGTCLAGTVRGMHFQRSPFAEMKLVTCIAGAILDVAVDLRRDSPTFLQHVGVELSADNVRSLLIPEGCAHGFQALSDDVHMIYAHSAPYRSEAEGGLHPQDPGLGIVWPLPVVNLSPRDFSHPFLSPGHEGFAA